MEKFLQIYCKTLFRYIAIIYTIRVNITAFFPLYFVNVKYLLREFIYILVQFFLFMLQIFANSKLKIKIILRRLICKRSRNERNIPRNSRNVAVFVAAIICCNEFNVMQRKKKKNAWHSILYHISDFYNTTFVSKQERNLRFMTRSHIQSFSHVNTEK